MSDKNRWSLEDPAKRARVMQLVSCGALGLMPYRVSQAGWVRQFV